MAAFLPCALLSPDCLTHPGQWEELLRLASHGVSRCQTACQHPPERSPGYSGTTEGENTAPPSSRLRKSGVYGFWKRDRVSTGSLVIWPSAIWEGLAYLSVFITSFRFLAVSQSTHSPCLLSLPTSSDCMSAQLLPLYQSPCPWVFQGHFWNVCSFYHLESCQDWE